MHIYFCRSEYFISEYLLISGTPRLRRPVKKNGRRRNPPPKNRARRKQLRRSLQQKSLLQRRRPPRPLLPRPSRPLQQNLLRRKPRRRLTTSPEPPRMEPRVFLHLLTRLIKTTMKDGHRSRRNRKLKSKLKKPKMMKTLSAKKLPSTMLEGLLAKVGKPLIVSGTNLVPKLISQNAVPATKLL